MVLYLQLPTEFDLIPGELGVIRIYLGGVDRLAGVYPGSSWVAVFDMVYKNVRK